MKFRRLIFILIILYLIIGIIFGISSFKEREDYASKSSRISDLIVGIFLWPFLLIARLICHSGDFLKILQGCRMLPPGLS